MEMVDILSAYEEVLTYYEGVLSTSHLSLVTLILGYDGVRISVLSVATWIRLLFYLALLGECWMA